MTSDCSPRTERDLAKADDERKTFVRSSDTSVIREESEKGALRRIA